LGVTGKRVRHAFPAISPSPAFRAALKEVISNQLTASSEGKARGPGKAQPLPK